MRLDLDFGSHYAQGTNSVVVQFECGTRILRVIHAQDARVTSPGCTTTN
jgi:hypothetical protein